MFCSKCGAENVDGANFCIKCGEVLAMVNTSTSSLVESPITGKAETDADRGIFLTADFINSQAFDTLLGSKSSYYREQFLRIYELKKLQSYDYSQIRVASGFNLWAGLLTPIWLGYRGVYKWAWFYVLLEAIQFSQYSAGINQLISFIVNLVVVGFFGNYWYYESLNSKLQNRSEETPVLAKSIADGVFMFLASIGAAYAFNTLIEMIFAR